MRNGTLSALALGTLTLAFTSACSIGSVKHTHTSTDPANPCIETKIKTKVFELVGIFSGPDTTKTVRNKCTGETLYHGAVP
jgi:hypothetical protein